MSQPQPDIESARICQQALQAFSGDAWHGSSLKEILAGINADQASARPLAQVHSIWEIVLHLIATQDLLIRRLDGDEDANHTSETEAWPRVTRTDSLAWAGTLERLANGDAALRKSIAGFPANCLDQSLIPGGSSAYNNFHGYIQHNLYHAAQIKLLKVIQDQLPGDADNAPRTN